MIGQRAAGVPRWTPTGAMSLADFTGVDASGTVASTAAIQLAMDESVERGMVLYVPAGEYLVDEPLIVPAGLRMSGNHPGGYGIIPDPAVESRISLMPGSDCNLLVGDDGCAHVHLQYLHLNGNKSGNASGNLVHLEDADEEAQWHINHCYISDSPGEGIHVGYGRRAMQIADNVISFNTTLGVFQAGPDGHITRNIIGDNGTDGVQVAASVLRLFENDIYGNRTGVVINENIHGVMFMGNGVDRQRQHGVYLAAGSNLITFVGNFFHSNSQQSDGGFNHVSVFTDTGDISFTGNLFGHDELANNPANCIFLDTGATAKAAGNIDVAGTAAAFTNDAARLLLA